MEHPFPVKWVMYCPLASRHCSSSLITSRPGTIISDQEFAGNDGILYRRASETPPLAPPPASILLPSHSPTPPCLPLQPSPFFVLSLISSLCAHPPADSFLRARPPAASLCVPFRLLCPRACVCVSARAQHRSRSRATGRTKAPP